MSDILTPYGNKPMVTPMSRLAKKHGIKLVVDNTSATPYHQNPLDFGASESLICVPYLTTMLYMPPGRRTTFGVKENTVRFSVSIEPVKIIVDDNEQGLHSLKL